MIAEDFEELFEMQLQCLKFRGHLDQHNQWCITGKALMEMLVRPAFGDDDEKYEKLADMINRKEEHLQ